MPENIISCKWVLYVLILLICNSTLAGKIIYVDDDATGANNGSSWQNAYNYLQDALADANTAEKPVEIRVAQGIYKPDRGTGITPGNRDASFQLTGGVTLAGGFAGLGMNDPNVQDSKQYETILSGDLAGNDIDVNNSPDLLTVPSRNENSYNVLTSNENNKTSIWDGFTITGGNANSNTSPKNMGGGIYIYESSPSLTGCKIINNSAVSKGGGIYCNGAPTINNCIIKSNYANKGGGLFTDSYSGAHLTNTIVTENSANDGAGVYSYRYSTLTLRNCAFSKNHAVRGNAVFAYDNSYGQYSGTYVTVYNSILWDGDKEIWNDSGTNGANIDILYSNILGGESSIYDPYGRLIWGKGNIDADPLFADPNNGDYHLKSQAGRFDPTTQSWVIDAVTSPCIDAGDPNSPIGYEPFPNGGYINMGAYGGAAQASKSYFGKPLCGTIVAGDINGDCKVDLADLEILMSHWLTCNDPSSQVQMTDVKIYRCELVDGEYPYYRGVEEVNQLRIGDIFTIAVEVKNWGSESVRVISLYGWDFTPDSYIEVIGSPSACLTYREVEPQKSVWLGPLCGSQAFKANESGFISMVIHLSDWNFNMKWEYVFYFDIEPSE